MELKMLGKKIEEIKEFIKNGFYDKALSRLNEVMDDKNNAENVAVMLEMGQVFLAKKDFDKARIWFEKVLAVDEYNKYALKSMLNLLYSIEKYDEILFYIKKILVKKEKFDDVLSSLVNFLFKKLFKYNYENDTHNVVKIINILNICKEYITDLNLKNIILNEYEILNKKYVLKSKPRTLIISLTSKCNIKCKMCKIPLEHWDFPHNKLNEIFALFPYLKKIIWHGGEPFLYPYIEELIVEAGKYNIEQIISTNGLLLNEGKIKKIINSGMELNISIHGLTKEVYESIHCGASYNVLLNNIELIKKIKTKSEKTIKYGLKFLVMKSNYKQVKNLYDFAVKYGFNHVYVNTLGYDTINEENFMYHYKDAEIIESVIENSKILSEKFKQANIFYEAWLPEIKSSDNSIKLEKNNDCVCKKTVEENKFCCYMPWQGLQINIGGYIRNSCYCENLIIGNITQQTISDIWNGNEIINIRKNIIKQGFDKRCSLDCKSGRISKLHLKNRC